MTEQLTPVSPTVILNAWVNVVVERLRADVRQAVPGHCVRLADLPRPVLEGVACELAERPAPGVEVYFVDRQSGPEPWRVTVHKVVERRNAEECALVALFPPDIQLAAGDSVDVSTFRVITVADLPNEVENALINAIPASLREQARAVLSYLWQRRWPMSATARLTYLATLGQQQRADEWIPGAALYTLGLIPDFALMSAESDGVYRLGRNIPIVEQLTQNNSTTVERLLNLPLKDPAFCERLITFFSKHTLEDVAEWGQAIACDATLRDYALDRWPIEEKNRPPSGALRIDVEPLKLPKRKEDGLLYLDPAKKVVVAWQTTPAPMDVPELDYFRVELLNADRVIAWESPLIKSKAGKTAKRSRTIKDLPSLDSGIYFFRVVALNGDGDEFPEQELRDPGPNANAGGKRINETEDVFLAQADDKETPEIDDFEPLRNVVVRHFAQAEALARLDALAEKKDPNSIRRPHIEWTTPATAQAEIAYANIRFDVRRQYSVRLSQRLRTLEWRILEHPDDGGHYTLRLGAHASDPEPRALILSPDFAETRRSVFAAIRQQSIGEDDEDKRVIALVDLSMLAPAIEAYARAYQSWLDSGDQQALRLDVIEADLPEFGRVGLVAPTHPLRLLWALQEQSLERTWTRLAWEQDSYHPNTLQLLHSGLPAQSIPPLLVLGPRSEEDGYMDAGPLPGGWGAYLPPQLRDSRAALSLLRARVGAGSAYQSGADIAPNVLAEKFELFLRQHPYSETLVINAINAGDAELIVAALIELEQKREKSPEKLPGVRYTVSMFSDAPLREGVPDAFMDLVDPDRQISDAAALLQGSGESFLFPKLSWSRNRLNDFVEDPEAYPAHITLLLDTFPVALRVARTDPEDRSSFVYGLVQEAPRRFAGKGRNFAWAQRPAPRACVELSSDDTRSAMIADLIATQSAIQATVLAPVAGGQEPKDIREFEAVAALDLSLQNQSLLYSAHVASTWVLTLDPHLGVDYFDTPRQADQPGYLLDFTPEFVPSGARQLLLTTRIDDEIVDLMNPAAAQLDLHGVGPHMLLDTLRSLSGRLALKLLSAPTQVQGAMGMALSRLFLEAYGLLEDAIVIPLDAHPELVTKGIAAGEPLLRGDLLVVSADPDTRHLRILAVEAKRHAGSGLDDALRQEITEQLTSSVAGITERFDPHRHEPDRLDRAVQSWQLSSVLSFYLERAIRYGLVSEEAASALRRFFLDLDAGYSLSTHVIGLVFRSGAQDTYQHTENPDLPIWVVGSAITNKIVGAAFDRFEAHSAWQSDRAREGMTGSEKPQASMADDETWASVRTTFGKGASTNTPATSASNAPNSSKSAHAPRVREEPALYPSAPTPQDRPAPPQTNESQPAPISDAPDPDAGMTPSAPHYEALLGDSHPTPQYGLLGTIAAEPSKYVALDLNGCNTISVFGVQGSGKSYTVGSIIEMSTMRLPGLNALAEPLGAVVFHFSQTQDYPPEFISMTAPNDDEAQRRSLAAYGATPQVLSDALLLTTRDTLEQRRREFPNVDVQPIAFASAELSVADWRFLMGATDNDALYLKLLNEVMRQTRDNLSLETIRAGLARSPMSDPQRLLAQTRLDFAARFIDDSRSLRTLLKPGRLVIVDLRDEFVEKEQALGLFVSMLNVFAGSGIVAERFNKLIVFDEAHKYMGSALSDQVIGVIREMRHRGVSVVIASQDPINVPSAVIELSSTVILHRFNSPNWIRHIQRSLSALGDLTPQMFTSLGPGEAFVWANKATDPIFTRRPIKLRMRPRVTKHGGSTRNAVE